VTRVRFRPHFIIVAEDQIKICQNLDLITFIVNFLDETSAPIVSEK